MQHGKDGLRVLSNLDAFCHLFDSDFLLKRPITGAFLFVLYAIAQILCHSFMRACYHRLECEVI